jgi:hypothetical protein
VLIYACIQASIITSLDSMFCLYMYTCSYSSNPIYLPFDASPSEHVNIFYLTLNYRDFANYRFRKLQISQTADFANYRFRKLQISFRTADFVSFRFVNYSKPCICVWKHFIIIQLTSLTTHWGFSVTDHIKCYDYLC